MLGIGENMDEVLQTMRDLQAHQVDILTLGQYLRPSPKHLPIVRYVPQAEFNELRQAGLEMGFAHVEAGRWCAARITRIARLQQRQRNNRFAAGAVTGIAQSENAVVCFGDLTAENSARYLSRRAWW